MTKKNYYVILGVSRGESQDGIRNAFRQLAKKYHPDRIGGEGTHHFQNITEAYETLSDPQKREAYNRHLHHEDETWKASGHRRHTSRNQRFYRHSRDPFSRYSGGGSSYRDAAFSSSDVLSLEALLSPEEALSGADAPIDIPFMIQCPFCRGTGQDWLFSCERCQGFGIMIQFRPVIVSIPAGVREGDRVEVPVPYPDAVHSLLRIRIRIQ